MPQAKRRYKRDFEPEDAPGGEDPRAVRRVRRPGDESADGFAEDDLREEIDFLNARLQALTAQRSAPRPTESEARGAKYFRLTRKASTPAPPRASDTAPLEPAAPVQLAIPPALSGGASYRPPGNAFWLWGSAGVLALAALAFTLGSLTNRPAGNTAAVTPVLPTWSEPNIAQLDRVLDTAQNGNLRGAYRDALGLDKQLGGRSNLEEYAATLEARQGGINNAEADLVRKADLFQPPRETAAAQESLGFVYARRRDFNSAIGCFASAAAADPLDPLAFYYWGESLRRAGRLPEAIDKFRETLLRLPAGQPETDSLSQCAAFRMRLCQIEAGSDADLKTAVDAELRRPVPSVYWLLTAVAYALQHNDLPTAEAVLQRIKVLSQPGLLDALLNDYFLRSLATRNNEIASYFPELTAERRKQLDASLAYFIDP